MSGAATFAWGALWGAVSLTIVGALTTVLVLVERKISGRIQMRVGPMHTGPHGLLQTVADIVKLLFKEDVRPARADAMAFRLGPLLTAVPAVLSFAVIPFGAPLIMRDLNVGVLYFLAVPGVTAVGLLLAGWASYDNYSFLGGLRSSAQFISYEIPRTLAVVGVVMLAGSLRVSAVLEAQRTVPFLVLEPLGFVLYLVTTLAEVNRTPFDIPEAESELVAGYHTEYSGFRWALFFLAEYGALFAASAFATVLFLGGGNGPLLPAFVWFLVKTLAIVFLTMWIRWTLPRFRSDQLMRLAWKVFLPLSLVNLVLAGLAMQVVAG
ncbi:MAG: NADH-quinone oxidoreductase subunit NuoH [Actinobacteria bacterium]|nr:NADH-quinone oxidoreductase subunit NuoH [Actinomycetota bacterium]